MARTRKECVSYRRSSVRALLSIEPRLARLRIHRAHERVGPLATSARLAHASGSRTALALAPVLACRWIVRQFVDPSDSACFFAPALNQPRSLRVIHTAPHQKDDLDLSLTVDGSAPRCTLNWGHAQLSTDDSRSPESLARVVSSILEDRVFLIRTSIVQEHGMGGPQYHTLCDHFYDRAENRFLNSIGDQFKHCCEAAAYSWSGNHDTQVVAQRCELAADPYHSHNQLPEVRLPISGGAALSSGT